MSMSGERRARSAACFASITIGDVRFLSPWAGLGVLCLFVYVGVEVMAGDAIGTYGHGFDLPLDQLEEYRPTVPEAPPNCRTAASRNAARMRIPERATAPNHPTAS